MASRRRGNGAGSVGLRADGRWWARYSIRAADGHLVRRALYGDTRREVEDALIAAMAQRNLGSAGTTRGRSPTLAAYAQQWLTGVGVRLRPASLVAYRTLLERHVLPVLGRVPLVRLEVADVNRLLADKLASGLSPQTVHGIRAALRCCLSAAVRDGSLNRNVAALSEAPRVPYRERPSLSPAQAREFLTAAAGERDGPLWAMALMTGARRGELLGLQWSDYDASHRELRITKSLARSEGNWELAETKTARSRRTVPLPELGIIALDRQRALQAAERLRAGERWSDKWNLIFTAPSGTPRHGADVTHQFETRCRALGLPPIRFHDLRHATASFLASSGLPPETARRQLGHASIQTTLNVYTHQVPEAGRLAADALDAILSEPVVTAR